MVVTDIIIADHTLIMLMKTRKNRDYASKKSFDRSRCTSSAISEGVERKLLGIELNLLSVDSAFSYLYQAIETSVNELVSTRTVIPNYSKRWYTTELRQMRAEESIAHNQALVCNDSDSWANYRVVRNCYSRSISKAKNEELQNIIRSCQDDRKQLWTLGD